MLSPRCLAGMHEKDENDSGREVKIGGEEGGGSGGGGGGRG